MEAPTSLPEDVVAILGWRQQVRSRLGPPPLFIATPEDHLHAEVLRVHGDLLEYLRVFRTGAPEVPAGEDDPTPFRLSAWIAGAVSAASDRGIRLPLVDLVRRFELTADETRVLLLAVARALAPGTGPLIAAIHNAPERDVPSVALATALLRGDPVFAPPRSDLFGADSRLLDLGFVRLSGLPNCASDLPNDRLILPSHAVVSFLLGRVELTDPLIGVADFTAKPPSLHDLVLEDTVRSRLEGVALSLDTHADFVDRHGRESGTGIGCPSPGILGLIVGPAGCGKTLAASAIAGSGRRPYLRFRCERAAAARDPTVLVNAAFSQARLLDAIVGLDDAEALLGQQGPALAAVMDGARRHRGLTLVITEYPDRLCTALESSIVFQARLGRPDAALREQLWECHLPGDLADDVAPALASVASQYELTGVQVRNAVASAMLRASRRFPDVPRLRATDLEEAGQEQLSTRLEGASELRRNSLGLGAIVLPKDTEAQVREFLDGCRHRNAVLNEWGFGRRLSTGKGIVALFSGEPGTGKTFCAEILAGELGMGLNVVSVPQVMSKWVGETEKNLSRLFSHARAQNTMLMFDEADALFTTRVKVETASDRFSNMEVNQLLQEIDRFEGIVILTTNLESSMDRAFQRRVSFHVVFPMPEVEDRARIWRTLLPAEAPTDGRLNFQELAASYELAGGHIKNILVRAAYRARARGQPIDMALLNEVAEDECRAAGKLYRKADAGRR